MPSEFGIDAWTRTGPDVSYKTFMRAALRAKQARARMTGNRSSYICASKARKPPPPHIKVAKCINYSDGRGSER